MQLKKSRKHVQTVDFGYKRYFQISMFKITRDHCTQLLSSDVGCVSATCAVTCTFNVSVLTVDKICQLFKVNENASRAGNSYQEEFDPVSLHFIFGLLIVNLKRSPHQERVSSSKDANRKSQQLFVFVRNGKKHEGVSYVLPVKDFKGCSLHIMQMIQPRT